MIVNFELYTHYINAHTSWIYVHYTHADSQFWRLYTLGNVNVHNLHCMCTYYAHCDAKFYGFLASLIIIDEIWKFPRSRLLGTYTIFFLIFPMSRLLGPTRLLGRLEYIFVFSSSGCSFLFLTRCWRSLLLLQRGLRRAARFARLHPPAARFARPPA